MTCQEIYDLLTRQDDLDISTSQAIEQHVHDCASCRREWDEADSLAEWRVPVPSRTHLSNEQTLELSSYSAGPVSDQKRALWQHVLSCPACYDEVAHFRHCIHGASPVPDPVSIRQAQKASAPSSAKQHAQQTEGAPVVSLPQDKPGRTGSDKFLKSLRFWSGPMPKYAFAGLALIFAAGWMAQFAHQRAHLARLKDELNQEKSARASLSNELERQQLSTRLIPDDSILRGKQTSEEPTIFISTRPSVVNLELPAGGETVGSEADEHYRAVLEPLQKQQEILSENLLKAQKTPLGRVVVFSFPSTVLEDSKDYVVDLERRTTSGIREKVNTFTFHVARK